MKLKYRIISTDPFAHSFVVRYYSDEVTEDQLASSFLYDSNGKPYDIARTESGYPVSCHTELNLSPWKSEMTDEELEEQIISSAPIERLKIQKALIDNQPTAINRLHNRVGAEVDFEYINVQEQTAEEIDRLLREVKIDK
jgi:hypothetical protein